MIKYSELDFKILFLEYSNDLNNFFAIMDFVCCVKMMFAYENLVSVLDFEIFSHGQLLKQVQYSCFSEIWVTIHFYNTNNEEDTIAS